MTPAINNQQPSTAKAPQLKGHWFSQLALLFSENFLGHCLKKRLHVQIRLAIRFYT